MSQVSIISFILIANRRLGKRTPTDDGSDQKHKNATERVQHIERSKASSVLVECDRRVCGLCLTYKFNDEHQLPSMYANLGARNNSCAQLW